MPRPVDPSDAFDTVTLRIPRGGLAGVLAIALHVLLGLALAALPLPKKPEQRVAITLRPPPPRAPTPSPQPQAAGAAARPRTVRPPRTPVAPVLPPSSNPPENRVQLPPAIPEPSPPSPPQPAATWKDQLQQLLAATGPKEPTGVLAPSFNTLAQVADSDPRLHDEENEQRLAEDFGQFFRRGLEQLRSQWKPEDVLQDGPEGVRRRCATQARTTFAVAVINKAGDVVDVDLRTPSGCPELDDEAIAAFRRVAVFPYPPAGLFQNPDGTPSETARYPVRFIVTFDGRLRLDWR